MSLTSIKNLQGVAHLYSLPLVVDAEFRYLAHMLIDVVFSALVIIVSVVVVLVVNHCQQCQKECVEPFKQENQIDHRCSFTFSCLDACFVRCGFEYLSTQNKFKICLKLYLSFYRKILFNALWGNSLVLLHIF